MAKVKTPIKKLPLLKGESKPDEAALNKLKKLEEDYKTKFKETVELAEKEALVKFSTKIASLTKGKTEIIKEYDAKIKEYTALVRKMKKPISQTQSKQRPPRKPKPTGKPKASNRPKAATKLNPKRTTKPKAAAKPKPTRTANPTTKPKGASKPKATRKPMPARGPKPTKKPAAKK